MAKQIFVNLPIQDLKKSVEFFTKLGFTFNPQFTDETATCMVISDNIFAMLLTHPKFQSFTKKPISDAKQQTEVIISLDADSRAAVDTMVDAAVAAGGKLYREPADHGWMYERSFEDLDGHQWEVAYMDITKFPQDVHQ
jgi:predicted lactoylglutathione lyase